MHYVYILYSSKLDVYYKGYTRYLEKRLDEHTSNKGRYTKNKGPRKLVFSRSFGSKSDALKFEKMLKRQNRRYLDWLISQNKS